MTLIEDMTGPSHRRPWTAPDRSLQWWWR